MCVCVCVNPAFWYICMYVLTLQVPRATLDEARNMMIIVISHFSLRNPGPTVRQQSLFV